MNLSAIVFAPVLLATAVLPALSQEKKDAALSATYKVEWRIKDGSDAAAKNGRRYTMLIDTTGSGSFHVGDRVPVPTGPVNPNGGATTFANTQFSYYDVGINIDTRLREQPQGKVEINSTLELSALVRNKADGSAAAVTMQPTVSQIKIVVNTTLTPGKPSLVASIDDPVSERKFEVEAVVTKIE